MDKEKAARILAKEIGNKLGIEAIFEEVQKDYLIRNCSAFCQVGKPVLVNKEEDYYNGWKNPRNFAAHMCEKLFSSNSDAKYFNYIFLHTQVILSMDPALISTTQPQLMP